MDLFERLFSLVLQYVVQNLIFKMEVLEVFIILQVCKLLEGLIFLKDDKDLGLVSQFYYEYLYIFILMWIIGVFLEWDDRIKVEEFMRSNDDIVLDLLFINRDVDEIMFDYMVDINGVYRFRFLISLI